MRPEPSKQSRILLGGVLLAVVGTMGAETFTQAQDGEDAHAPTPERAAQLFSSSCASCHVYPDVRLPTDRAWLGQIMETS